MIPLWIWKRHQAQAKVQQPFPFECESCGHRQFAKAVGTGQGVAGSSIFFGMAAARDSARRAAVHEANKDARIRIGLVPCPRCGQRNRRVVGYLRRRAIGRSLLVLAAVVALAWLLRPGSSSPWWRFTIPCALLIAIVLYLIERRRWTSPDRQVTFVGGDGPTV